MLDRERAPLDDLLLLLRLLLLVRVEDERDLRVECRLHELKLAGVGECLVIFEHLVLARNEVFERRRHRLRIHHFRPIALRLSALSSIFHLVDCALSRGVWLLLGWLGRVHDFEDFARCCRLRWHFLSI